MIIQDAVYKTLDKIEIDDYKGLDIDNANHIIDEISDNLYVLRNKIEDLNRIGDAMGISEIADYTEALNEQLAELFDGYNWQTILRKFQEANDEDSGFAFNV